MQAFREICPEFDESSGLAKSALDGTLDNNFSFHLSAMGLKPWK